ncbi:MAG: M20/M25/M40 family metallo-hydrolase [Erysipelotrichaceae bacterium]|nr:M20/M25/M40 family metallo-hydrolase [Erysipelotrichaceae bacterium]
MEKELLELIDKETDKYHKEEIETLLKLCSIDSGSKDKEGIIKVIDTIASLFKDIPVNIERIETDNGENLIIRFNKGKGHKIILNAHMDTVFKKGDVISYPSYIKDEYLYGLGSSDCKGGIVVSLYSLLIAFRNNLLKDREYTLIYGCDEEIGSPTSRPVYVKEAADADYALVYEPSRGNNGIITSRRSCANAIIEVYGKAAHSSEYTKGANAVIGLSNIIQKLNKTHDPERNIYINIGEIQNSGPINQVSDYARMEISCRVETALQAEEFFKKMEECIDPEAEGLTSKISFFDLHKPMERNEKNIALYEKVKEAGKLMNLELEEIAAFGSGDASIFSECDIPVIDALGSYTLGMHTKDEHTLISSLKSRTMLSLILLQLL